MPNILADSEVRRRAKKYNVPGNYIKHINILQQKKKELMLLT